jgi:glycosyltransferase involved in cell wall biosynthesis
VSERFQPRQLAFIVPTKDRPEKLRNLLTSIADQDIPCGRILIIDGGESVKPVTDEFADRLPVEHHPCQPPGQIRQRNLGISLLTTETPLVGILDDDIVLEPGAIAAMVAFWNQAPAETAAVSFNIVNTPPEPRSWVRDLFLMSGPVPGRVLKSGATTSTCQTSIDLPVEWVCGGATVWRADVLREYSHREVNARWAIAEDIIFSYPVSKRFPMFVCAGARVRHEHLFDYRVKQPFWYHGRTRTLWMWYFVERNASLSRAAFLWMTFGSIAGRTGAGVARLNLDHLRFAAGQVSALWRGAAVLMRGRDFASALEEKR